MKMKNSKKPKYLGKNTKFNQDNPDNFILDPIDNPHPDKDYSIRFSSQSLLVYAQLPHNLTLEISHWYVPKTFIRE